MILDMLKWKFQIYAIREKYIHKTSLYGLYILRIIQSNGMWIHCSSYTIKYFKVYFQTLLSHFSEVEMLWRVSELVKNYNASISSNLPHKHYMNLLIMRFEMWDKWKLSLWTFLTSYGCYFYEMRLKGTGWILPWKRVPWPNFILIIFIRCVLLKKPFQNYRLEF